MADDCQSARDTTSDVREVALSNNGLLLKW